MLNFRLVYLRAMREQAPAMFNELRRTGTMNAFLEEKVAEAAAMFRELTSGSEALPSGALDNRLLEREATELVMHAMLEFPPLNATP